MCLKCGYSYCYGCIIKNNNNTLRDAKCFYCKKIAPFIPNWGLMELIRKGSLRCRTCKYPIRSNLDRIYWSKNECCYYCQVPGSKIKNNNL